ncbi:MAG: septum formation initiator family protein [Faecousia sp.]
MKRKSSLITKLIILAVVIYAVVTIVALQPKIDTLKSESNSLNDEVLALQEANRSLLNDIEAMDTDEGIMKIARERLNLVADGEWIFIDKSK